jgi:predicted NAD/FAD-binding protein
MSHETQAPQARQQVAVVGSGVAGLTAAHLLSASHDVTLIEAGPRAGGHTNTVTIPDGPDAGLPVDTGFIVMNERNYPLFTALLRELRVETQASDMTFGYHDERTGLQYAGTGLAGLFARRRQLVDPSFLGLLGDIGRFNAATRGALHAGQLAGVTLAEHVASLRLGARLHEAYLYPMAAAIWSAPLAGVGAFPAESFARFFDNHGLLTLRDAPQWRTVAGGSQSYVRALLARFPGTLRLATPVASIQRRADGVTVAMRSGELLRCDHVVLATHADQALALLARPTPDECRLLGSWRYAINRTVLHCDPSVLPPRRAAWASWNYAREAGAGDDAPVSVTYHMNRLQRLKATREWCVTLNRRAPIDERRVVATFDYAHPQYDFPALASQAALPSLQGVQRTWYCGSYFGFGFHEDAVRSAHDAVRAFGAVAPRALGAA